MEQEEFEARMAHINKIMAVGDQAFAEFVVANQKLGFGRMMQIISYLWRSKMEHDYPDTPNMANGAFVSSLFDDLDEDGQRAYLGVYEGDIIAPYSNFWKRVKPETESADD